NDLIEYEELFKINYEHLMILKYRKFHQEIKDLMKFDETLQRYNQYWKFIYLETEEMLRLKRLSNLDNLFSFFDKLHILMKDIEYNENLTVSDKILKKYYKSLISILSQNVLQREGKTLKDDYPWRLRLDNLDKEMKNEK